MASQKPKIYSVSRINLLVKSMLEQTLPSRLTVSGEITGFKEHSSGHCYFSLKDEDAVLSCVMWKSSFAKVKFEPENGLAVLATGYIDVYIPQGKYQLYVEKLEPAGTGALQLAFEQMVRKLERQGLFNDEHKKPLPCYPQRIGILTSESGAALHDIADSIKNRWPPAKLLFYPVPVQGTDAAEKIAAAIRDVNRRNISLKLDLLIVGRGGGSLEDLWAFNEEILARAVFDSAIPIISAVGHEIDTTISDLVADARASTPTKAGIIAVPDKREVLDELYQIRRLLHSRTEWKLQFSKQNLQTILASAVFRNPTLPIRDRHQRLDELTLNLVDAFRELVITAKGKIESLREQIRKIEPHHLLSAKSLETNNLQNKLLNSIVTQLNNCRVLLTARENRLAGLNPRAVLSRGYSITTDKETGLLIRKSGDIEVGREIITELAGENLIESVVTNKQNRNQRNGK